MFFRVPRAYRSPLTRISKQLVPSSNMRKGETKSVADRVEELAKRKESIRRRCNPAFFEIAPVWKESVEALRRLGPNPPAGLTAKIEAKLASRLKGIQRKYSGPVPPPPNTFAAQAIFSDAAKESDAVGVAEWAHFQRHRTAMKVDLEKRQQKDWPAGRRILRTLSDLERLRCGQRIQPFKGDLEHSSMFQTMWGLGLEKLSPEELADVFDWYCPCGSKEHDPEALKKQRNRFKRLLSEQTP